MTALRSPASHRLRRLVLATGAAAALLPSGIALASGNAVIRDCTDDGRLEKTYTQKQYADALKNIPTDVDEYTDCRDVIRRAQLAGAGGHGGGGGAGGGGTTGGGGTPGGGAPTPNTADQALQSASVSERAAVETARKDGASAPVQIGGTTIEPSRLTRTNLDALSTVPTPLLIVLALLVIAALAGGGSAILQRVRTPTST